MGKKSLGAILVLCLLLTSVMAEARIRNRQIDNKANIDLGKINTEADPNEHRAASDGYNQYILVPTVTNTNQQAVSATYNGAIWYDTTDNLLEACINGAKVDIGASASVETLNAAYDAGANIDIDAAGGTLEIDYNAAGSVMTLDADTDSVTVADCIKAATTGTSSVITDFVDASDADIVNALNVGANVIIGTGGASINFDEFDVASGTGSVTIDDVGNLGSLTVEGTVLDIDTLTFVGAGGIVSAASSAITLDADSGNAAGEDLIVNANNVAISAAGTIALTPDGALAIAIDATDTDIVAALSVDANSILGTTGLIDYTYFDVDAAGAVTCTALDAGSGTITTTGDLDVGNVLESAIQPASGNLAINGATGASTITIGNLSTSGITISDNVTFGVTSLFSGATGLGFRAAAENISSSGANQLDIDATTEVEIATASLDCNLSGGLLIDAVTASNITVTTESLTIQASDTGNAGTYNVIIESGNAAPTSGEDGNDIALEAEDDLLVQCTDDADFDVADMLIDATTTISLDAAAGASNFTTTGGDLTLESTDASVNINATEAAADQVKLNAQGTVASTSAINILTTDGGIMIDANGAANGDITIAAADALDLDSAGAFDMLAGGVFSIDGTGASNVTAASGNLTVSTTTSGTLVLSSAGIVDIDATYPNAVTVNTADDSTADATAIGDITITAGAKGAGTGDGGDVILIAGDTTGGTQGYIKLQDDVLVQTTEKIYFQDTGTFINSPADGKIEIEADGAGADDITLDGGITVPTGHVFAMTDAGSITLAAEKVTAHKEVAVAVYATANTANSFGILPIVANCKITHISIGFVAIPASGAGTVLLEVYNRDGGAASDNLLGAATYDLEGMTNMVAADMSLTATTADLQPDDSDFVYCVITSNNGDMTGGTGGVINVKYTID